MQSLLQVEADPIGRFADTEHDGAAYLFPVRLGYWRFSREDAALPQLGLADHQRAAPVSLTADDWPIHSSDGAEPAGDRGHLLDFSGDFKDRDQIVAHSYTLLRSVEKRKISQIDTKYLSRTYTATSDDFR